MRVLQWEEYLEYYHEQKRLGEYQRERSLHKPKTTKLTVVGYGVLLLFLIVFVAILLVYSGWKMRICILLYLLYFACLIEFYGRLLAIKCVECYQHYAKESTRRKCKCIPSCSEYAILCLKKYELVYALRKIKKRLLVTCQGFDYIRDDP